MAALDQDRRRLPRAYRVTKRALDIGVAALLLVVTAPALLFVAALVRWRLGPPVFFRQTRAGRYGRPFELVKLRTMLDTVDSNGHVLPDHERLTRLGRVLRTLSLDELPQLWNVLRGEMSLVGPRPLLVRYLPRYSPVQLRRHDVLPGITGWAQVNGRNAISWEERFGLDLWYVEHASLLLDLKILLWTACQAVVPTGISSSRHATMPEFEGSGTPSPAAPCRPLDPANNSPPKAAPYWHV